MLNSVDFAVEFFDFNQNKLGIVDFIFNLSFAKVAPCIQKLSSSESTRAGVETWGTDWRRGWRATRGPGRLVSGTGSQPGLTTHYCSSMSRKLEKRSLQKNSHEQQYRPVTDLWKNSAKQENKTNLISKLKMRKRYLDYGGKGQSGWQNENINWFWLWKKKTWIKTTRKMVNLCFFIDSIPVTGACLTLQSSGYLHLVGFAAWIEIMKNLRFRRPHGPLSCYGECGNDKLSPEFLEVRKDTVFGSCGYHLIEAWMGAKELASGALEGWGPPVAPKEATRGFNHRRLCDVRKPVMTQEMTELTWQSPALSSSLS